MSAPRRNYWLGVALLALALPIPHLARGDARMPLRRPLADLPHQLADWRGRDKEVSQRTFEQLGTTDVLLREYRDPAGHSIGLYVSYFERQRQGEANHSPRHCLPGAGWQPVREERVPYSLVAGPTAPLVNQVVFAKDQSRQLVLYWFRERDRVVASEYLVKLYLIWDSLLRRRTDGALVRVSTPVSGSETEAQERLRGFLHLALPDLDRILPE